LIDHFKSVHSLDVDNIFCGKALLWSSYNEELNTRLIRNIEDIYLEITSQKSIPTGKKYIELGIGSELNSVTADTPCIRYVL